MAINSILSLDGGGMKGLFQNYFMQQYCLDAGIPVYDKDGTPNPNGDYSDINKYFGLITGSSIGGITALAYAMGYSPNYVIKFLTTYGPQIFTSAFGTPMPTAQKAIYLATYTFAPPVGSSFYGAGSTGQERNAVMVAQLNSAFNNTRLQALKTNVIITSIEYFANDGNPRYRPVLFSNLKLPGLEGQNYLLTDVCFSTSAAPTYFPPIVIGDAPVEGLYYIDGGVGQNNPASIAYNLSSILNQGANVNISLLSVGCGLGTVGYFEPPSNALPSNIFYLADLIGIASGVCQETVNIQLQWASKFNRNLNYFRFNTIYPPDWDTELDNSGTEFNAHMKVAQELQYSKDAQRIFAFIRNANKNF